MSKEAHYEELLKQLDAVESNPSIIKALDARLSNSGQSQDYEGWINSSLQFLEENEHLFINTPSANVTTP